MLRELATGHTKLGARSEVDSRRVSDLGTTVDLAIAATDRRLRKIAVFVLRTRPALAHLGAGDLTGPVDMAVLVGVAVLVLRATLLASTYTLVAHGTAGIGAAANAGPTRRTILGRMAGAGRQDTGVALGTQEIVIPEIVVPGSTLI